MGIERILVEIPNRGKTEGRYNSRQTVRPFSGRARSDPETQKLLESTYNNPNPPYESFTTTFVEDVEL